MAMNGMEQMLLSMVGRMGIDPEAIKAHFEAMAKTIKDAGERLERVERSLAENQMKLDEILSHVRPPMDGGYMIASGDKTFIVDQTGKMREVKDA